MLQMSHSEHFTASGRQYLQNSEFNVQCCANPSVFDRSKIDIKFQSALRVVLNVDSLPIHICMELIVYPHPVDADYRCIHHIPFTYDCLDTKA